MLALVVREATTNILRHSEASHAALRLRHDRSGTALEISNNAISSDVAHFRSAGTGLAGLADRLSRVGGTLDTTADSAGHSFELRVWVPLGANARPTVETTA